MFSGRKHGKKWPGWLVKYTLLFYKQYFYKQAQGEIGKKLDKSLSWAFSRQDKKRKELSMDQWDNMKVILTLWTMLLVYLFCCIDSFHIVHHWPTNLQKIFPKNMIKPLLIWLVYLTIDWQLCSQYFLVYLFISLNVSVYILTI